MTPRYPAATSKRGMARAIEIVEWMRDFAAAESASATSVMVATVWKDKASHYDHVVKTLKTEAGE